MKKILSTVLSVMLFIGTTACGGDANSSTTPTDPTGPPDLSGQWKQINSGSEDSYQGAIISGDKIEIYWVSNNGDTRSLYWSGSFDAPNTEDEPYYWNSRNNTAKTSGSMLASGVSSKRFTYENGQISYSSTIMGTATNVRLEKMEWEPGLIIEDDPPSYEEIQPTKEVQGNFNTTDCYSFSMGDLEFLIPNYFEKSEAESTEDMVYFNSNRGDLVMLLLGAENQNGKLTQAEFEKQGIELGNYFVDSLELENRKLLDFKDITIAGQIGYLISATGEIDNMSVTTYYVYTYRSNTDQLIMLCLIQFGNPQYDYLSDYEKIFETARLNTKVEASTTNPTSPVISGIRPEFKAAMDSYEKFFDEYIEFMQKFSNSNYTTGMLSDYMDYMEKYSKMIDEIDALDDGNLSPEEEAYYLEVTTRILQKHQSVTQ